MRLFLALLSCVMFLQPAVSFAQADSTEPLYRIETLLTVGIKRTFFSNPTTDYSDRTAFQGVSIKGRVFWFPDHLLGIGIQSGYELFSQEEYVVPDSTGKNNSIVMQLSGAPLHLAFEMRPLNFRFGVGLGVYFLTATITSRDIKTRSSDISYGVSAVVGYEFDLWRRLHVGPEVGLYVISDRGISSVAPAITIRYDLFEY